MGWSRQQKVEAAELVGKILENSLMTKATWCSGWTLQAVDASREIAEG